MEKRIEMVTNRLLSTKVNGEEIQELYLKDWELLCLLMDLFIEV